MFKKECVDLEERRKIVYTAIKINSFKNKAMFLKRQ